MTSLYDIYSKIIMSGNWKYYPFPDRIGIEVLSNSEESKCFIQSYLGKGCKTDIDIYEYLDKITDDRICHILSCFFLGVTIYNYCNKISSNIDKELKSIPGNPEETPNERFLYVWMLISIFHDFGYAVEDKRIQLNEKTIRGMIKKMPPKPCYIPNNYSKQLLLNYNIFRKCRFGVDDHGIIGGAKLYVNLCDLREEKEKYDNSHFWGESLKNDFGIAAWTIACHNIFYKDKSDADADCYICSHLRRLLYEGKSRLIICKDHPLLFLFCMVDNIEPLKSFQSIDYLKYVVINICEDIIAFDCSRLCSGLGHTYLKKIEQLDKWLTDVCVVDSIVELKV